MGEDDLGGYALTRRDQAMWVARAELTAHARGTTEQFLAVHEISAAPGGEPDVARVDETREPGAYYVYFSVKDEPYYFVVVVAPDRAGTLYARATYVEARVRAYLGVYSDQMRPAEITARVGLEPTEAYEHGERIPGWRNTYKRHTWWLEPQAGEPAAVEEKLIVLLYRVEPAAARIAALRPACDIEVAIVFDAWRDWMGGFHFSADVTRRIVALGAAVDFDLYASGPEMPDPT